MKNAIMYSRKKRLNKTKKLKKNRNLKQLKILLLRKTKTITKTTLTLTWNGHFLHTVFSFYLSSCLFMQSLFHFTQFIYINTRLTFIFIDNFSFLMVLCKSPFLIYALSRVMWFATKKMGMICHAVLTFIGYRHPCRQ